MASVLGSTNGTAAHKEEETPFSGPERKLIFYLTHLLQESLMRKNSDKTSALPAYKALSDWFCL